MKAKITPKVNWKQLSVHYKSIFLEAKKKNTMIKNNVLIKNSAYTQRKKTHVITIFKASLNINCYPGCNFSHHLEDKRLIGDLAIFNNMMSDNLIDISGSSHRLFKKFLTSSRDEGCRKLFFSSHQNPSFLVDSPVRQTETTT